MVYLAIELNGWMLCLIPISSQRPVREVNSETEALRISVSPSFLWMTCFVVF